MSRSTDLVIIRTELANLSEDHHAVLEKMFWARLLDGETKEEIIKDFRECCYEARHSPELIMSRKCTCSLCGIGRIFNTMGLL